MKAGRRKHPVAVVESGHVHAAVDVQGVARDVARIGAGEEGHGARDVGRLAQPAERDLAQHGVAALVGMLQAELGNSPVRVSALQPGPMRTSLRSKAYVEDEDHEARDPADYAKACVTLLSSAGAEHRGKTWEVRP